MTDNELRQMQCMNLFKFMMDNKRILLMAACCDPADPMSSVVFVKSPIIDKSLAARSLRKLADEIEADTVVKIENSDNIFKRAD